MKEKFVYYLKGTTLVILVISILFISYVGVACILDLIVNVCGFPVNVDVSVSLIVSWGEINVS